MSIAQQLEKQVQYQWLVNCDNEHFYDQIKLKQAEIAKLTGNNSQFKILLSESNPEKFLAVFLAAALQNQSLFLANPQWQSQEWAEVEKLVQPNLVWNDKLQEWQTTTYPLTDCPGKIMIPTGGSSGKIRFTMHNWQTLKAAVKGFVQYFGVNSVNSCCFLPLYHVSGLMQCLRSFLTGGKLWLGVYQQVKQQLPLVDSQLNYFVSLVPTQLQFILDNNPAWLSQFATILVGGGPARASLLKRAAHLGLPIALTYGMTETAAQVVVLKPSAFLQGNKTNGQILPHAKLKICSQDGKILPRGSQGIIYIEAESLCLGYYPRVFSSDFCTNDLGILNSREELTVIGRRDRSIISGGEIVFPQEIEEVILATGLVKDVCVFGLNDDYWGETVVAVYVEGETKQSPQTIAAEISKRLSRYKCPKHWFVVNSLSRNAQGKINYQKIKDWLTRQRQG